MESQRPHGVGRMVYKDGNRIHEGFWSHGHREGHGRCLFAKIGDYHEGEYNKNLRHGPGKYFWKDGRRFVGNYHLDERCGEGKFVYPNGDAYIGNFDKGSRSGFGEFTFSNRSCSYRGEWQNSTYHGTGTLRWITSKGTHIFEGDFQDGMFHGQGIEYLNNVVKRSGCWSQGSYQGVDHPISCNTASNNSENGTMDLGDTNKDDDETETYEETMEKQLVPSKEECPTTLEQNYSDSRSQWKDFLEPESA
jgi:hypothetical protein